MSPADRSAGVLAYHPGDGVDAIDEYCRRLAAALRQDGDPVRYLRDGLASLRRGAPAPAWILLQYNPFAWGRWGFAPGLLRDAALVRRRTGSPLALMVHEAWVDMEDLRTTVMGAWQRLQLHTLLRGVDLVLTSTEALAGRLGSAALHVPIAATVTPARTTPSAARAELGLGDGFVVALFGRGNPARALDHAEAAVSALARASNGAPLTVLNLGADAPPLRTVPGIEVRTPGPLTPVALSRHLWASDLMLLPFTDGVSTRRTTLMAALAHGRPVLGLRGDATDSVLLEHPDAMVLTRAGDPGAFARAAVELAGDRDQLRATGDAGRRLYAERFDWPVIARTIASTLRTLAPRDHRSPAMA
jgi:glycosyltransferase involved in cell wall biosynthesis